jgi:hypothetical protein
LARNLILLSVLFSGPPKNPKSNTMEGFLLLKGRVLSSRSFILSFFLLLFSAVAVQAKTVVIGSGSGFISVPNMNGLNPGDILAITPGQYSGAVFNNLKGITITNNGGTVIFSGTVTLNTLAECVFSDFQFKNVQGISIRWDGVSRRCVEINISFTDCNGSTNDAADHNTYNGDTSSLKLYLCTFDSLTLFRSGMVLMGGWGEAKDGACYMDSIVFSRIKIDSTLSNGTEVRGIIFRMDAHDWKVTYKGINTVAGDVGIFYFDGNGRIHNIYRIGGRGYMVRVWNVGLKVPGNTYFYNNIDLNSTNYGSIDTRVDPVEFTQFTTGGNCYIFNNTAGNKEDHMGYWSALAVVGTFSPPWICQTRNNLAFNLQTNGKPKITMNQSSQTWVSDSSNNMYFDKPDGVVDPITCVPVANSPVLGKGLTLPIVQEDIYHNPRLGAYDIGAVQHGGAIIPPPPNQPPVVLTGAAQTITLPASNTILDGSRSYDPDGSISSYAWVLVSGTGGSLATPSSAFTKVSGLTEGTYIYKLTVTDNNDDSAFALDTIMVNPADTLPPVNILPVANAGPDQTITAPSSTVNLDGSGSYDPDGIISAYTWVLISGPGAVTINNSNTGNPTVTGLIPGVFLFQLTVTDSSGAVKTDQVYITVNPEPTLPNQAPVANAGNNQTITAPLNSIALNGSSSFDPDGTIIYYGWNQVSGPSTAALTNGETTTPTVSGLIVGTYAFQLMVTDNNGSTSYDQVTVTVQPMVNKVNQMPVAFAGSDTVIYLPANAYLLNASDSYDPDGNIMSYQWQEISGPNTAVSSGMNSSQVYISNLQEGIYQFQLTVTDNEGGVSMALVKISVDKNSGSGDQLTVYPNPAHDLIQSRISCFMNGTIRVNVYDMNGKTVLTDQSEKSLDIFEKSLNISALASGMYTIQVSIANSKTLVTKFIKL